MATGKALFDLIKTLSPSEKRSFTRNINLQKKNEKDGNNTYYKEVFDVLAKLGEYNREEILVRLNEKMDKEKMNKKKLQDAETYLYKKLIVTLKISYTPSSIEIQLHDQILEAQILHKKGLYELAIKTYQKAEKKALDYHKMALLLEIIPQKAAAIVALQKKNVSKQIDNAYQVVHDAVLMLKEEMIYRHENIKLTGIYRTNKKKTKGTSCPTSKEVARIYQKTQVKAFPKEGSFFSQYYYCNILALAARLQKKHEVAIKYQEQAVLIWEQYPHIIKKNLSAYMTQLSNLINYFICGKEYHKAEVVIKKLENLRTFKLNTDEKGELFQNIYFCKQMLYLNEKKYEASKLLIQEIENGLKLYGQKINVSRELTFLYNIGITFWLSNDFDQAFIWFDKIPKSTHNNEHRPDIVRAVHLLQLAIFYELNDEKDTDSEVDRLANKLRAIRRKEMTTFESILIYFFDRLNDCVRPSKEEQAIFLEFKKALKKLEGKQIMGYEEYCVWVDNHCKA